MRFLRRRVTSEELPLDCAWFEDGYLAACAYPRNEAALAELARRGVTLLINLHRRAHDPALLARHKLTEVWLPVRDFTPPTPRQLSEGVAAIDGELAAGGRVAVHCGAGLGRTGTLVACYYVRRGLSPEEAIARVRAARHGAVETPGQVAAVAAFAAEADHSPAAQRAPAPRRGEQARSLLPRWRWRGRGSRRTRPG